MERMILSVRRFGQRMLGMNSVVSGRGAVASAAASCIAAALLSLYRPVEGLAPLGAGFVSGLWYAGASPWFACAGAFVGSILTSNYAFAAVIAAEAAVIFFFERLMKLGRVYRLLVLFGAEFTVLTAAALILGMPFLYALGTSSVSLVCAVITGHGVKAMQMLPAERPSSDSDILSLAACTGLVTLSLGRAEVLGQNPAVVFAALCSLTAAYRFGVSSLTFAVTAGAARALLTGGDLHFTAVLAASALIAAALRAAGKAASVLGFAASCAVFYYFTAGTGRLTPIEAGTAAALFLCIPARLYCPGKERLCGERGAVTVSDTRYNSLQYSISGLAEVLNSLARVFGNECGTLLNSVSDTLRRTVASPASGRRSSIGLEYGSASAKKDGSEKSGDSLAVKRLDCSALLCISDGMGSGGAAGRESRQTVELICDLIAVGFDMQAASDCINRLMARRARDDMYSTLDALLIDLEDGTARIAKLGASPSYVLRGGRLYTLYDENLPLGIVEQAEARVRTVKLRRGDVIIMMTDGVYDALGCGLAAALTDLSREDMQNASREILEAAKAAGCADDMTVLTARLY